MHSSFFYFLVFLPNYSIRVFSYFLSDENLFGGSVHKSTTGLWKLLHIFEKKGNWLKSDNKNLQQQYIPVGCVLSAAVVITGGGGGGGLPLGPCLPIGALCLRRVSAQGGVCGGGGVSAGGWGLCLPGCFHNYVADGNDCLVLRR